MIAAGGSGLMAKSRLGNNLLVLLEARQPTSPIRKTCAKTLCFFEILEKAGG